MTMTEPNTTQSFTESERRTLSILADMIVPASGEFGVPSAGDATILDAILSDAVRHRDQLCAALVALEELACERYDASFVDLAGIQRNDVVDAFRDTHSGAANLIANLTTQCYYRDDRVMISLGMEPRPPHPVGFMVEQGDWSLLEPVRKREKFFRATE
jgi:hypothetical protein